MNAKRVMREAKALERKAKRNGGNLGGGELARLRRRQGFVAKATQRGYVDEHGEIDYVTHYDDDIE